MKRILFFIGIVLAITSCTKEPENFVPYRSEQVVGNWHVIQDNRTGYDTTALSYDITIAQDTVNLANATIHNFANCGGDVNISVGNDGSLHILSSDTSFAHGNGYLFSEPISVASRISDNNNWFELQYTMEDVSDTNLTWNGWLFVEKI